MNDISLGWQIVMAVLLFNVLVAAWFIVRGEARDRNRR